MLQICRPFGAYDMDEHEPLALARWAIVSRRFAARWADGSIRSQLLCRPLQLRSPEPGHQPHGIIAIDGAQIALAEHL